jgi:23S rRNA pseudoU1915 N3-methylase RlmH
LEFQKLIRMFGIKTLLFILSCFAVQVYSKTTVMVVLGCAMQDVQQERIAAAIDYAKSLDDTEIVWFVTGGVKNAVSQMASEAEQMRDKISGSKGKIVLDEKAKNTAENFAYLKKWMNESYDDKESVEIVITTSEFHQERASKIFNGVFQEGEPLWNLSISETCKHCWNDEKIHMKNVAIDVKNAVQILA